MNFQPLLAADLIQTIFAVIVFILWAVGQFVGSREEAKRKKVPQRPKPQPPEEIELVEVHELPRKQPARNQPPRNQKDALRSEVEEFLRRAQGKQPKQKPAAQSPQMPPVEKVRSAASPATSTSGRRRPDALAPQTRATKQPTRPTSRRDLRSESVDEHVARHLSTDDIVEHATSLGSRVASADERTESRLHGKFDHDLGSLAHHEEPAKAEQPQDDLAVQIADMLRSPQGMRQVIIANEILRRPEW